MAKVAGTKGAVGYGDAASAVAGINAWALDYTTDMLETTDFSASGIASYIPGVSRWSGTFSGYKDGAPLAVVATGGSTVSLFLVEDSTTNWSGLAYISGVHPTANHDGLVSYAYDFQGTASLVVASA